MQINNANLRSTNLNTNQLPNPQHNLIYMHTPIILPPLSIANAYTHSFMEIALPDDCILAVQVIRANPDMEQSIMDSFFTDCPPENSNAYDHFRDSIIAAIKERYPAIPPTFTFTNGDPRYLPWGHHTEMLTELGTLGLEITLTGSDTNYIITITAQVL